MGISYNPQFSDVLQGSLSAQVKSITSSSEVIAAAGSSNLTPRQTLIIRNTSQNTTVWIGATGFTAGPSGTGMPIGPEDILRIDANENILLYLRTESGLSASVVIWELG